MSKMVEALMEPPKKQPKKAKKKRMRLPPGLGSVHMIGDGKNRRNPWRARVESHVELDEKSGKAIKKYITIGYYPTELDAFEALMNYRKNPYTLEASVCTFEDVFEKLYNSSRFPCTCEYIFANTTNAFKTIFDFAKYYKKEKIENSLDAFTKALFEYFSNENICDKNHLRDMLAIDRLSTNKMGSLPEFLKVHSPLLKTTLNELEKSSSSRRKKGIKRAATVLVSEPALIYVDYDEFDKVKKTYKVNKLFINIEQK
jgi:hypothetical protein